MPLNDPVPGLHRLHHDSNTSTKVQINVPAGDDLEVSEDVAAQLRAADPHFIPGDELDAKEKRAAARSAGAERADAASDEDEAGELPVEPADAAESLPPARVRRKN